MRNYGFISLLLSLVLNILNARISTVPVALELSFTPENILIVSVDTVRRGKVRRAKLYYLRDRVGKAAKVKERIK